LLACGTASETGESDAAHSADVVQVESDVTLPTGQVDSGTASPMPPAAQEVDPGCVDGKYTEDLPVPSAGIDDLIEAYTPDEVLSFIIGALERRYPVGAEVLKGGLSAKNSAFGIGDCVEQFLHNRDTASQVISSLSTLVHECGHGYDISLGGFSGAAYFFTPETQFTCQGGSIPDFGGKTFARSLIMQDEYAALHTPCLAFGDKNCDDTYAAIYLNGDPEDGEFESGDQGFDTLLEETVQYVNSLATDYAFSEYVMGSVSARDGLLTFLWYVERYLRMARLEHPDVYAHLIGDSCWRQAMLTTWGRAWLFLSLTEDMGSLGIDDAKLINLVRTPELLDEIRLVREAEGCL